MIKTVSFSVKLTFSVLSHETQFEDIKQARLAQFFGQSGRAYFPDYVLMFTQAKCK